VDARTTWYDGDRFHYFDPDVAGSGRTPKPFGTLFSTARTDADFLCRKDGFDRTASTASGPRRAAYSLRQRLARRVRAGARGFELEAECLRGCDETADRVLGDLVVERAVSDAEIGPVVVGPALRRRLAAPRRAKRLCRVAGFSGLEARQSALAGS
jgi:hypothetical protein